ncbi:MAG: D-tyrosyl-tRNA(Tyr) deacylase [Paludibacteraceae bacterium]|nr:D-tyrosyl-tRNA(Tyr) deacylase [Paludibacteraceae bacterium]
MRVVVQRCSRAEVRIDGQVVGQIEKGFMVLVGIKEGDEPEEVTYLAKKVAQLRVFEDGEGKMNLALKDVGGEVLSISQFTLYSDCRKGNRPSFVKAARPEVAEPLYEAFNRVLREEYGLQVETGRFGAAMKVDFVNDGPVTILLDSEEMQN